MGDSFGEIDSRFTYCAVASLSLLDTSLPESAKSKAISFLNSCQNFDGGFGAIPGSESHGGNIFCCVSALAILDQDPLHGNGDLVEWLVWRQLLQGGFNGRPEKLPDVCYSWWILSSLATLNHSNHINSSKLQEFILQCQDIHGEMGGFADRPGDVGDIFHTLFGLTGLALLKYPEIKEEIDPLYCLPKKYL
jgi:geranylgeranyl transferase type-2 subunit beta